MSTVEELVARSREAQKQFEFATQEQADAAARAVCKAVYDNQEMLGKMAAEESRMGDVNDKIAKCRNKSALIWESLKGKKSVGVIRRIEEKRMLEIAKPVGVVCAVLPSTGSYSPTRNGQCGSNIKKTRNSIIFGPHRVELMFVK